MKQNNTIKRTLSALFLLLASTLSWADDFSAKNADGITIYYNLINDGTEAEVTNNDGHSNSYSGDVNIPETVEYDGKTLSVTSIGEEAFEYCTSLTSVIISNGVESIGYSAFVDCSCLTSVTIPNSVKSIDDYAFAGCSSLTSITVDKGNPIYDSRDNCNAIIETATNTLHTGCQSTIIPESVTSIGEHAFSGCSGLTSITIPNSVTSIGGSAFTSCSNLTSITIPNGVTSIGDYAFWNCSSLTSVTIPSSVTSIGDRAFLSCSSLTSITIPERVESIGNYAFANCSSLTSVTIPSSVTSIDWGAFYGCQSLTTIICRAENVPELASSNIFSGVPTSKARLYVPASALEEYKTASQWQDFSTTLPIVELDYALKTGWNTIALPFSADLTTFGEGAKAYAFTGAEDGTLNFSIADRLEAHTPYIIYAPEMQELSLNNFHDGTDPNATTEPGVAHGGITFRGTYEDIEAPDMEGKYGLADDGRLRKGSAQASIKAYHAYFEVAPGTEVKGITLDGDDATGIAVTADAPQRNGWYYNLAGQRTQKPRKGVNIVGGRKVLY